MKTAKRQEVCVYIPARGGSKGIPRKNLALLGGKPLIAHTIEDALECPDVDRVLVNTDCEEIAEVAVRWGAEVPFLRPAKFAGDDIPVSPAIRHMHDKLYPKSYDQPIQITLYPTSPFRPRRFVSRLVEEAAKGFRKVFAVKRLSLRAHTIVVPEKDGRLHCPLKASALFEKSGERLFHRPYGLGCAFNVLAGTEDFSILEVRHKACFVDIDTPADLKLARRLIDHGLVREIEE